MKQVRIAIAEPDKLFLQGITALLSQEKSFQIVVSAGTGERFLQLLAYAQADVALMDMNLPRMNGIETLPKIRKISPQTSVVIWSKRPQPHHIIQSMRLGAVGFLQKACDLEELSKTLKQVATGQICQNTLVEQAMRVEEQQMHYGRKDQRLSPREEEVLRMLCLQKTNREIADQLQLSSRTVEGHRKNLLAKTGMRNLAGLVLFAVKEGLVRC
jgi:DNA-binding NarL/FixJ family response regulator